MLKRAHTGLKGLLALVAHVDLACWILPYKHYCEARYETMILLKLRDSFTHSPAQTLSKSLTVNFFTH